MLFPSCRCSCFPLPSLTSPQRAAGRECPALLRRREQERAARCVCYVVPARRRVIDGVPTAARGTSFETRQLSDQSRLVQQFTPAAVYGAVLPALHAGLL